MSPLYDLPGTAIFPGNSRWGHFIFIRMAGEKQDKPQIVAAAIERCPEVVSKVQWRANFRPFTAAQVERGEYNPQMSFPIGEVPALIAALSRAYEEQTRHSAPPEGQVYVKQYLESEQQKDATDFVRGSSEF